MSAKKAASKKKTKKTAAKKVAGKVVKKAAKKIVAKKTAKKTARKVAKKAAAKAVKKTAGKKVRKSASKTTTKAAKKVAGKGGADTDAEGSKGIDSEEVTRRVTEALKNRESKTGDTDSRKGQPIVFSMDDLREFLQTKKASTVEKPKKVARKKAAKVKEAPKKPEQAPVRSKQSFGAASVADLLGFDPTASSETEATSKSTEDGVPKKFLPYYRALVQLHEEVYEGLHRHTEETLRRSNKEDSGDLSSYGQHMADAGTDSFDRDFALSMVSSEQEALYEIDEAIRRIREGNYGVCEITGKPISRERLRAVPFTRYSVEGQIEVEKGKKKKVQKAGIQGIDGDDAPVLSEDDNDE